ncbi:homocysteine S-methyltransferase family protein [Pseudomonadales bacterium]|nr:homocysteine S-methyltransferase family protein [Pseudomonadales bacterium]MDC0894197.1 homocysteine S-methyltransferase family protein [Pseudomonadales bacterium]
MAFNVKLFPAYQSVRKTNCCRRGNGQPSFSLSSPTDKGANDDGYSTARDDLTPQDYLAFAKQWQALGATIIGGCCGIGPEHIALLDALKD